MTLSSTTTKITYNGDGSTTVFTVNFVFWNNSDLRVIHRNASGVETVWAEGTHYTLTGGSGATGSLTVETAPTNYTPAAGETLTLKDYQSETQGDSLPLSGAFPSTVVEQRLDRITRLIQIHSEEIARSILLPETASLSGLQIPEPGAGELVRYNPAGTSLETVRAADLSLGINTLLTALATNDFLYWDNAQSAWVNITPGTTGLALFQNATATDARSELGLGTAAVVNTGVANGSVPAMDATGYPAADGSRITNVHSPRGHIDGLILSNNATDAAKDIDIAAGVARDDGNAADMTLSSTLVKRLDASWAAGTNQGGLDGTESMAGTPDADTWYHCWLIRRSDTEVMDVLFSESATAPTMPLNYDQKRRIGAVLTDGAANIVPFFQRGDDFVWKTRITDLTTSGTIGTAENFLTLSTPLGVSTKAAVICTVISDGNRAILLSPVDSANEVPNYNFGGAHYGDMFVRNTVNSEGNIQTEIWTDISSQIRWRNSNSSSVTSIKIITKGWVDPRGRNA